ncbi:hypothetical protein AB1A81_14550 [Bdellovibrio bacteriovorus]|nr:hypothetical protein [Bdellovibrio bacteriovorus]AHZ83554.1 hypothetical protein EP01_01130 [Bdellovibrio bacteriovorus]BEV69524.1 hypothetical protein Bb109J_c2944 [Bdellovibrio bacteriovorus]
MMKYIGCVLAALLALPAQAAISKQQSKPAASKILSGEGVSFGGLAGTGFTLMDVRRTADAGKKVERIVIDVGDINGGMLRGWPGYYYAELKKNPQRLVVDFAQMPNANIDQKRLAERLKGSLAVVKTNMSLDPVDSSLNLTLDLKKNTKVRVYQVAGKKSTSKVVIDLITE